MKARKGFTLVELLIVIVIIGILAAAMLLSSGSASDSAEAARIISDLRNMKAAAQLIYLEMYGMPLESPEYNYYAGHFKTILFERMDNPESEFWKNINPGFGAEMHHSGYWIIYFQTNKLRQGVREKLAAKAASVGLYGYAPGNVLSDATKLPYYKITDNELLYFLRYSPHSAD